MRWILNNLPYIGDRLLDHLALAVPAIILSFLISIPLGWLANRFRPARGAVLSLVGLFYAIPSLPLFLALPAIIGTGLRDPINVTIGLTLYGLALMIRSTADALQSVDADITQSATAMGFSTFGRFWKVDLPLAGPVLLAGIRVVAVSTISLTTVGAVLGISSLGSLFTDGFARDIQAEVYTGIVLTIAMALLFDFIIVLIGRMLMPWTKSTSRSSVRGLRARRARVERAAATV